MRRAQEIFLRLYRQFKKPWKLRTCLYVGASVLLVIVAILSLASTQGVLKYRSLIKDVRNRATELPLAAKLAQDVADLRVSFASLKSVPQSGDQLSNERVANDYWLARYEFRGDLEKVGHSLRQYEVQLAESAEPGNKITDTTNEKETVSKIRSLLNVIESDSQDCSLVFNNETHCNDIQLILDQLQTDVQTLPTFMTNRMEMFAESARAKYRAWLTSSCIFSGVAFCTIVSLALFFRKAIFKPLQTVVEGSREVAAGEYDYRVQIDGDNEIAELANALNAMTNNFQEVQRDLNDQVQQRTREVVRSEQMASVGFLAAGVAHEINNPLAAIAWSAESLEMRVHEALESDDPNELPTEAVEPNEPTIEQTRADVLEMQTYLRRIQDEAFRCKGITDSLLDFSRLGDSRREPTDLVEIVQSVIDMVRPLSKYRRRNIEFLHPSSIFASVIAHEIKQVTLNLLTNALDSVEEGGHVKMTIAHDETNVTLTIEDDGCGMTEEVQKHLFEPFFTRREDGRGTGLGLSITYRIIDEHGGTIEPSSDGPNRGAKFVVTLPLVSNDRKIKNAA